ncbi:MAG: hypothetical protein DI586_05870 [Micavibrio aeruginosavorus]|uniref:Chromosome partition protein Smc n=1 Tax=Micavibrio aeruginosavorus TaxID=349221 RepID=A0A2W5HJ98_9BACT|nr:MAG: hypothetical protein DI586_05870 [Micavibrio aeruginosavorus]
MARSIYALGFLTFGLLATTSIVTPAKADTAQAQTAWTINRVASAASGSYCTMAQKYSDNTIITFAKNSTGQYSVAFDFARPQFPSVGQTMVTLRPGNGEARTFNVAPTSDKVVVIGLGEGSFIDAVKSSGKMDVETGGKAFSYAPSKFVSAADELSDCIGGKKSPAIASADPTATPVAAPEAPAEQKMATVEAPRMIAHPDAKPMRAVEPASGAASAIENENARLIRENQVLRAQQTVSGSASQELSRVKAELATAQALNQSLAQQQKQAQVVQQQLVELQKQNTDMKAQLSLANQNVTQLQTKAAQSAGAAEQLSMLQKQNADMKLQLEAATKNIADLQVKNVQSGQIASQLGIMQKQNADAKVQLDAANATIAQLQAKALQGTAASEQLASMQKQSADMKAQLDAANANIAQLQTKAAQGTSAAEQVSILQKQSADMKAQLDAANATISQLQTKVVQGNASNEQLAALQKENADLKIQLGTSNAMTAQLQTKAAQGNSAAEQVALLQKQNAEMKAQLDAAYNNSAALQSKLAQMPATPVIDQTAVKENESLKQQITALQAAVAAKPVVTADNSQLSALQGENSALKQQLAAVKSMPAANDSEALKHLQGQLELARSENETLKQQLDKVTTASAGGNSWDLEQATKRYQESQREIRRLGALVQQEKLARKQDRDAMEAKLFDPAITDQMQQEKLAELQGRIDELEGRSPSAIPQQTAQAVPVSPVERTAPVNVAASIAPAAGIEQPKTPAIKPVMPVASAVISPVATVKFQSQEDFSRMLQGAGINIRGGVESVETGSSDSYRAYRWKTDSLFGSAEQRAMKSGKGFDAAVNDYLDRAKTRCEGDFAAVPSDVVVSADKAKSFEFACIGNKANTSASVMFTYSNDVMTIIAHEGKSEAMDLAMEARDRMASQMSNIKTAAK